MMKNTIYSTGLRWLWLTIIIVIIDLSSKQLILNKLQLYELISLIPYLNIIYVQNSGAAFGFLADKCGWQRWFLIFITLVICIVLVITMYHQDVNRKLSNIAYTLIIGGALGNFYDRIIHGFVIDFIEFYIGDWHWPIFNIADIVICIGVMLIIIDNFINRKN